MGGLRGGLGLGAGDRDGDADLLDRAQRFHGQTQLARDAQDRLAGRGGVDEPSRRLREQGPEAPYDPDPPDDPIELGYEDFLGSIHRLQEAGFVMEVGPEEAWEHFRGWRVNYESVAYELCDLIVAPPGPWSGARHHLPGMEWVPQRPADRRTGDPDAKAEPKITRLGWRS